MNAHFLLEAIVLSSVLSVGTVARAYPDSGPRSADFQSAAAQIPGGTVEAGKNAHAPVAQAGSESSLPAKAAKSFLVHGVVKELRPESQTALIAHERITNYMDAMTMPFHVKPWKELSGLEPGDQISFRLNVTETESWIDRITKTGSGGRVEPSVSPAPAGPPVPPAPSQHPLLNYPFTNELGQPVRLSDFQGQALAITFFFTRCPIPDFCPRLSRNFAEASRQLKAMSNAPTNWHFLSVTFDPRFDTPAVLKAYGEQYHYDPKHWTFLTGPVDKIGELARLSDVTFEPDQGFFNHNFRTLIIDAAGHLQMTFPIGGDLSGMIVSEVLKAAAATNAPLQLQGSPSPAGRRPSPIPPVAQRESSGVRGSSAAGDSSPSL